MKRKTKKGLVALVLAVLVVTVFSPAVFGDEKTGNLVFTAMKKIQETHQVFLSDVKDIRQRREQAIKERDAVRLKYEKAKDGSLDKREFHAQFSYAQAKLYRALYEETRLTHEVAGKQLGVLNKLNESIASGKTGMNSGDAAAVIEASKPLIESGKSLLTSLAEYRDKITDPVINSKLNAAYETARMLSRYVDHIENGKINKYASQLVLKQKLVELVEQLNALYVQTDIFMAMIQDKTTVLKMINQLAASETAICAISDGRKTIIDLSTNVMAPLMDVLNESDDSLTTLVAGALDSDEVVVEASGGRQNWANADF
jgi:regulator of replication initiation timing